MLSRMFRVFVAAAVLLSVCFAASVKAQDPDFVVSVSSLSKLQKDLTNAATKLDPKYAGIVQVLLMSQAPAGIDADKPFGLAGAFAEGSMEVGAFGSVSDADAFKTWFDAAVENETVPKGAELTQEDGTFVVLPEKAKLKLPKQPLKLLGNLPSEYLVAAEFDPSKFVDLGAGLAAKAGAEDVDSDETQKALEETKKVLKDIKKCTLGLNFNEQGDLVLNAKTDVVAGSELDKQLAKSEEAVKKAMLMGFYDKAADAGFYLIGAVSDVALKNAAQMLDKKIAEDEDNEILKVIRPLILNVLGSETLEIAGSVNFSKGEKFAAALACSVKDGMEIDEMLRNHKELKDEMKFDVDKIGKSISVHTDDSGDLRVAIGISKKFVFLSVSNAEGDIQGDVETLKALVKKSQTAKAPKSVMKVHVNASALKLVGDVKDVELKGDVTWKTALDGKTGVLKVSNDFVKSAIEAFKAASAANDSDSEEEEAEE